jgi:hypothetical protein
VPHSRSSPNPEVSEELDHLVDRVAALSLPGRATIEGGIDARVALAAFLIRCREILLAVRALATFGCERVVDPLVRSSVEFAATSGWMMAEPQQHFAVMLGSTRRDLRLALREYQASQGAVQIQDRNLTEFLDAGPSEQQLPPMPERARIAGIEEWYTSYRLLSATTHGSLLGAFAGAQVRHNDVMVDTRAYRPSLLTTAAMTLFTARLANTCFAWGRDEALNEAVAEFNLRASESSVPTIFVPRT